MLSLAFRSLGPIELLCDPPYIGGRVKHCTLSVRPSWARVTRRDRSQIKGQGHC